MTSLEASRAKVARIMREDRRRTRRERFALACDLTWHCGGLFSALVVGWYCVAFFSGIN